MPGARARGHAVQHELLRTVRGALFGQRVSSRVVVIINQAPARAPSPSSELHRACPFAVPARRFPGGHLSSQPVLFRRDPKNPRRRQSFMLYRKHFTYGIGLCGWQVSSKQLVVAVLAANRPSRESICLGLPADWNARANGQAAARHRIASRASPYSGHHPLPSPAAFDSNVDLASVSPQYLSEILV